jgi:hypothetical protein
MSHLPRRVVIVVAAVLLLGSPVHAQPSQALAVPPESPRWELEGEARASEYQGRKCLFLDGERRSSRTWRCATASSMWTWRPLCSICLPCAIVVALSATGQQSGASPGWA